MSAQSTIFSCAVEISVYEDNDVSAFDKEVERPNYNRLIADIKAGKYQAVACVRGSRRCGSAVSVPSSSI